MDVDSLKNATGDALDVAGVEMKLDRATIARGHGFNEADDSYRRRLVAEIAGAAAADALSQPAAIVAESTPASPMKAEHHDEFRQDGPTVEEWVLAGYPATGYPPHGYAARSSAEEVQAAIAAQQAAKSHIPADGQGDGEPDAEKAGEDVPGAGEQTKQLP